MLYTSRVEVPEGEHVVPIGRADIKRPGSDVTFIMPLEDRRGGPQGRRPAGRA